MNRKMKVSGNFVSSTLSQSVTRLSFSVFEESKNKKSKSKIENGKLKSIFNFCFWAKMSTLQVTKVPQGELQKGILRPVPQYLAALAKRCTFSWNLWRVFSALFFCGCEFIVMASSKILDLSREGKNLRLRIAASDLSVSRLSRAFQASKCR